MNDRLKNYLALTAGFVAISPLADAQIIYTDVNPDIILSGNESIQLDINNDGIDDFLVYNKYNRDYGIWYSNFFNGNNGNCQVLSKGEQKGKYWLYDPKFLNFNDEMIPNPPFANWKNGGRFYGSDGLQDKYIGFRFKVNSDFYYGWARFDIAYMGKSITIKDYAYESIPNQLLKAGVSKVSLPDENPLKNIRVYSSVGSIRIEAPVNENLTGTIRLSDINGRELKSVDVKNEKTIELKTQELPTGLYIINILSENGTLNKKVLVR